MMKVKQKFYKFLNNNKQPRAIKLVNYVCAYNLFVVGPLTKKLQTF